MVSIDFISFFYLVAASDFV